MHRMDAIGLQGDRRDWTPTLSSLRRWHRMIRCYLPLPAPGACSDRFPVEWMPGDWGDGTVCPKSLNGDPSFPTA